MVTRLAMWWDLGSEELAAVAKMECTIPRGVAFSCRTGGGLEPVCLELLCEALVNPGVCLRVGWFSGVGQTI